MVRKAFILALLAPMATGFFGCADREEIRADRVAQQVAKDAEEEAACRPKGDPGSAEYDACRQELANKRAQKAEIEYQKRRDFDRVLGGLDDL
ncbi:hypothetical protein AUC69_03325 [Methyloceanibacter superfactus]|uniref:Uncharacterized protein n=1 Tax=Methyloceanibacter superfactus TaxID=1774969 RepID=A0A1E3VMU8_9HYPH|nr:hypothetical protein [Methyloceanibacter superfactus]ODR94849.1 hypothetical protein AUC69_03325 [Methyloceanibacter superfactus]